jgi:serine protease
VCVALIAFAARGRGQISSPSPLAILEGVGLPAIDVGVRTYQSHAPGTPEALRRAAVGRSLSGTRVGASGVRYVPGRVIVKFRDGASTASRITAVQSMTRGGGLSARLDYANFDVVKIDPNDDPEAMARRLRQRADVEYAQPVHRVYAQFVPNDPLYLRYQWNLQLINMERAWDIQPQAGSAITVAVVDTGMAYTDATIIRDVPAFTDDNGTRYPALGRILIPYSAAPELVTPALASRIVAPHDFVWNTSTPLDFDGHGTHVSGTIGQLTNDGIGTAGVAFNVKLMPVKVLAGDWDVIFGGAPDIGGSDLDVARGIRYAADNGARVINMSLGLSGPANCGLHPEQDGCTPVIEDAIRYAVGKGCFVALAGGNDFQYGNPTQVLAEIASRVQGAVSVAAVGAAKGHAYYSSTGPWVELAAPGGSNLPVYQQTFDPDFTDTFLLQPSQFHAPRFDVYAYVPYVGTSQATPHVSGVAAMLMQQGITSPAAVEAALEALAVPCSETQNTCGRDIGAPKRTDTFGFGLIDASASLRGLGLAR